MPDLDIGKLIGYVELDDSGVAEGAKRVEERVSGLGKSGASLAKAAGVGMGLAIAGGLASAISIDAGQAKLTAQLDLTASESQRYGGIAGRLYSGAFGENMDEVNEGIRQVVLNIGGMANASDADLERVSGKVLNLSQTFDQDLGGTTRAVGTLLRNGLAKDADQALDILTRGFQNGTNVADDLLDTVSEYSVQFRKLGLDGTTSLGLLHQGLEGGARDADTVADALKELSIRAIDGSKTTATAYDQLGLNADDMAAKFAKGGQSASQALETVLTSLKATKDPTERSAAAVGLFGTKAEDLGAALYNLDLDSAADGMGNVEGAAKRVGDALGGSAAAQFTSLTRSAQVFATSIGQVVLPLVSSFGGTVIDVVTPALSAAGSALGVVADGFEALPGPVQSTVITLAALVALRDPLGGLWDNLKSGATGALENVQLRAMYARDAMGEGAGLVGGIKAAATAGEGAARGGIGGLAAMLGGPLGIGIAAVSVGLPLLSGLLGDNEDEADDAARANSDLAQALRDSKGAIDDNVRAAAAKEAQDKGLLDVSKRAGISLGTVTDAVLGNSKAYDEVVAALRRYQAAHVESGSDGAAYIDDEARAAAAAEDALSDLAPTVAQTAKEQRELDEATQGSTVATDDGADSAKAAADAAQDQADAVDALKEAIDRYTGGAIDAAQAQINVSDGLADLEELTKDHTATLDQNTQAGRDAKGAFLDQIVAIQDLATATFRQTGNTDAAKDAYNREVAALRDRLTALGYNVEEVDNLIAQYGAIPESVFTAVGTNAGTALGVITTLKDRLETISRGTYYVDVYTNSNGGKSLGKGYGATGGVISYYAEGGYFDPASGRNLTPLAVGVAARVPANTWRVIGDRAVGDEFYLPDDDDPKSLAIGAEWLRRRGLSAVPLARYADGGILATGPAAASAPTPRTAGAGGPTSPSVLFTGSVYLRDERDAQQLAETLDWRRRTRGGRR